MRFGQVVHGRQFSSGSKKFFTKFSKSIFDPEFSVYEGEFVDSKFHGKGSLTWPDGSRYDGHFQGQRFRNLKILADFRDQFLITSIQDSKPDGEGKYYDVDNK